MLDSDSKRLYPVGFPSLDSCLRLTSTSPSYAACCCRCCCSYSHHFCCCEERVYRAAVANQSSWAFRCLRARCRCEGRLFIPQNSWYRRSTTNNNTHNSTRRLSQEPVDSGCVNFESGVQEVRGDTWNELLLFSSLRKL